MLPTDINLTFSEQMIARETKNEKYISAAKVFIGVGILIFHFIVQVWSPDGIHLPPVVFINDMVMLSYGLFLFFYVSSKNCHPLRKYIIVTIDILAITLALTILRGATGMEVVSYAFLYPQYLTIAFCGLRYSPRLVLYAGGLVSFCFVAFIIFWEGIIPFLIPGLLFTSILVFACWYTSKSMLSITEVSIRQNRLQQYFSPSVVEAITNQEEIVKPGGSVVEATILFSDIRSFTSISEQMDADELVSILNEYFEEMVEAIFAHHGMLDKFIGDAVMAVFGAPVNSDSHPQDAVLAAQNMILRLKKINENRLIQGKQPFEIGIGIHTGKVVIGNIGSPRRMDYTVIGDTVNVASRIEGLNKQFSTTILLSEETASRLDQSISCTEVGKVLVKGRSQPVKIYSVNIP